MVNIVFIKTFIALVKTRSFKAAAHLNNITQPAVSQQIQALETKLNCQLLQRSKKNIQLTRAGVIFFEHAQKILEHYENATHEITNDSGACAGVVQIATIYSIGLYRLQPVIRSYLRKFPLVNVFLEYYHNDFIYEKISNQTIDFGFVAFPSAKANLTCQIIANEEMILVQSPQRPVFKHKSIQVSDLNQCKFVSLSETTPTGKEINNAFKKRSIAIDVVHEFENVETLKSAVIIGMGCALVPRNTVYLELKNKTLLEVPIKGFSFSRPIGILKLKSKILNKPLQEFYDLIISKSDSRVSFI